jgi:lipopolysaccharide transport system permease protein
MVRTLDGVGSLSIAEGVMKQTTSSSRSLLGYRELFLVLIQRNVKIRYKNSALGFLWSLLSPLMLIGIYAVFARILRFNEGRPNYLQFLVTGIVMWQYVAMCLNDSLFVVLGNANLVKKTAFPRVILPASMVAANLFNFLLTWVVLIAYLLFSGVRGGEFFMLPVVLAAQVALCLGASLLISAANVFFRDTEHLMGVGMLAWFFMTPIFYPVKMQLDFLPDAYAWTAFLNPMTGIITGYRRILIGSGVPDMVVPWSYVGISLAVSAVVCVLGILVFARVERRFGDVL